MKFKLILIAISSLFLSACGPQATSPTPTPTNPPSSITPPFSPTAITSPTPTSQKPAVIQKTLRDLLTLTGAQKCTYQTTQNGQPVTSTIYLNGKKFKQVSQVSGPNNTTVEVTTISDGAYVYSYSSASATSGVKIKIDQSVSSSTTQDGSPSSIDWNKQIDYHCSPATVSDSDLSLPSTVNFVELGQTLQNLNQNLQNKIKGALDVLTPAPAGQK